MVDSAARPLGAYLFPKDGPVRELDWAEVRAWRPSDGWLWVHLDRTDTAAHAWLRDGSGLDAVTCDALLEEETRPRSATVGDAALLLILRGVNLNPGAEPDDMIALRAWFGVDRVVTLRFRRLLAIQDVRDRISAGQGPRTPAELLGAIAAGLVERQVSVVDNLEDEVADIEEHLVGGKALPMRARIAEMRRQAIGLRRYLAPQRDVLTRLAHERLVWLDDAARARLREVADRQTRLVEELDAVRERAVVAAEELAGRAAEQMNRNMYVLSIVTAVFLPLGLVTGLLGINVGGLPGTDDPLAFVKVCALLVGVSVAMVVVFRRFRLM